MKHQVIPYVEQTLNAPTDFCDPASAEKAIELHIPTSFSEKALSVLNQLKDAAFLYLYKNQFVLTDETLELTGGTDSNGTVTGPRWTGDVLEELEEWLEECADRKEPTGDIPEENSQKKTPAQQVPVKSKLWAVYEMIDDEYTASYFLRTRVEVEWKMRCFIRHNLHNIPINCMYGEEAFRASNELEDNVFSARLIEVNGDVDADAKPGIIPDFYSLHPMTLDDACKDALKACYTEVYDPSTMNHTSLVEFIEFIEPYEEMVERGYIRFGNVIVCVDDAWKTDADVYRLE